MVELTLGIDIGTTSVKTAIFNAESRTVEASHNKDTQAHVPSSNEISGDIQDVSKIISALNLCISKLPKNLLSQISSIGVSCQMHGILYWNSTPESKAWTLVEKEKNYRYDVDPEKVSHLYTWQDARCDTGFLSSLPSPRSHTNISTGFGVATTFWLVRNEPDILKKYNCSGTIGDFTVAMLCNLTKPVISEQNAASWGYFDCSDNTFNNIILQDNGYPVELLPDVKNAGSIAGSLSENWHSIPSGTPIGVAMGDLQCSILSSIETPKDAILNISTSIQITYIANNFSPPQKPLQKSDFRPYFNNTYIAVAASLNGGNSLATFVQMVQQWGLELGFQIPQSKVWEKVLTLASDPESESNLFIKPTCMGERHSPDMLGEINNIGPNNLEMGKIFRALCKGVIENLHSMMPNSELKKAKITRILGNGSALTKNRILQEYIEKIFELPLVMIASGESSTGAAMAMSSLLEKSLTNMNANKSS